MLARPRSVGISQVGSLGVSGNAFSKSRAKTPKLHSKTPILGAHGDPDKLRRRAALLAKTALSDGVSGQDTEAFASPELADALAVLSEDAREAVWDDADARQDDIDAAAPRRRLAGTMTEGFE